MASNLTIFANFFIDNEERFLRMKDSLQSLKGISVDRYVINVRGRFTNQVIDHLRGNVERLHMFSIESPAGWFYDTSKISHLITTSYVLLWIEDHICMVPERLNSVVNDMEVANADLLTYTFWQNGKLLQRYQGIEQVDAGLITWFDHTQENNDIVQNNQYGITSYLISLTSILKADLFKKIIKDGGREKRWSKMSPFDFEKAPEDLRWLPLRRASPKFELFASIDDDHGEPGSCLQSRGLYPKRIDRQSYARNDAKFLQKLSSYLNRLVQYRAVVSNIMHTPSEYRYDYIASHLSNSLLKNYHLPWMNYQAIDYLLSQMSGITTVFEYGSGQSTLFWLEHGKKVTSIEHDPVYYEFMCSKISSKYRSDYRLIEPELDVAETVAKPSSINLFHSADFKGYTFKKYVESINDFEDEYFDLVVVDGRARPSCIAKSQSKLRPGGLLCLDNSNRDYYLQETGRLLSHWDKKIYFGPVRGLTHWEQTTIYIKPKFY